MKNKVNVVFASNNKFIQHCGVAINSLIKNNLSNNSLAFFILSSELILESNKAKIISLLRKNDTVKFVNIDSALYSQFKILDRFSKETYNRLFFPNLFPNVKKFIYLDSDVIIKGDVSVLWKINLGKKVLGAVSDLILNNYLTRFGVADSSYFNAGVLLIDAEKFRVNKVLKKSIDFLISNHDLVKFPDQDALNYVLNGNWKRLGLEWNLQTNYVDTGIMVYLKVGKLVRSIKKPLIIHYNTTYKPWDARYFSKYKKEYYQYLKGTPWEGFIPENKEFFLCIKTFFKSILPFRILIHSFFLLRNKFSLPYIRFYFRRIVPLKLRTQVVKLASFIKCIF
jgi:lipopolysaccharide biosynthesis glycosyltransferase